jgi:preprotein translocase subunit SecG
MSSTQSFFGTSATKFLRRATEESAVVFLLTCLGLTVLSTRQSRSLMEGARLPQKPQQSAQAETAKAPDVTTDKAPAVETAKAPETEETAKVPETAQK